MLQARIPCPLSRVPDPPRPYRVPKPTPCPPVPPSTFPRAPAHRDSSRIFEQGLLYAYTPLVWTMLLNNAFNGLASALYPSYTLPWLYLSYTLAIPS